ncbi:MAG: glutathione S-transferase family protein [Gammaproteobacteria bacterium]|nr:glutathione S-transferase family protein [Gammaproteobacteria bacterium]
MSTALLYGLNYSVYTRIARIALEEKHVTYRLEEVDIFSGQGAPADYLKHHPFGKIPVLRHGGFCLYETRAITCYVDEAFPGPSLQPDAPEDRVRMWQTISVLDSYAYRPMIWDVFVERVSNPREGVASDEQTVARALPAIGKCLHVLSELLGERQFFGGNAPSLADLHATPILMYFHMTPEGSGLLERRHTLRRWLKQMTGRESVTRSRCDYGY